MQNHKKKKVPNHSFVHPSLQSVFCSALFCDQGREEGEEKRNIFAQAGAVCGILGLALDWPGAGYCFSGCSACAVPSVWEMGTFPCSGLCKIWFSLVAQAVGWGPGLPLVCLARAFFIMVLLLPGACRTQEWPWCRFCPQGPCWEKEMRRVE